MIDFHFDSDDENHPLSPDTRVNEDHLLVEEIEDETSKFLAKMKQKHGDDLQNFSAFSTKKKKTRLKKSNIVLADEIAKEKSHLNLKNRRQSTNAREYVLSPEVNVSMLDIKQYIEDSKLTEEHSSKIGESSRKSEEETIKEHLDLFRNPHKNISDPTMSGKGSTNHDTNAT